jgi:hypothetical protein
MSISGRSPEEYLVLPRFGGSRQCGSGQGGRFVCRRLDDTLPRESARLRRETGSNRGTQGDTADFCGHLRGRDPVPLSISSGFKSTNAVPAGMFPRSRRVTRCHTTGPQGRCTSPRLSPLSSTTMGALICSTNSLGHTCESLYGC